jgi:tRNA (mo5U34)-methyltransferase
MIDEAGLRQGLASAGLEQLAESLIADSRRVFTDRPHGDLSEWQETINLLPVIEASRLRFDRSMPRIGRKTDCDDAARQAITAALRRLMPWRKGPFALFGIEIDSEWRSDLKWARLENAIAPLQDRTVLDVGCGNGYYLLRMLGEGARLALGIDPTQLFNAQFALLQRYCGNRSAHVLPLRCEQFPAREKAGYRGFDTVFSMGILYHRREPLDHIGELISFLRPGGELVLESLVVEGAAGEVLVPPGRYAKMRNVWSVPATPTLESWLQQAGLEDVKLVDCSRTTGAEQRVTPWMQFESLADFLDPDDPMRTLEGHPAPRRALFTARSPG